MKTVCRGAGFYNTGLSVIFGLLCVAAMTLCSLILSGTSVNAQQKKAETPVYNTQIPVYKAPSTHPSQQPLVRQWGSGWAHPAPPAETSYTIKKNRGSAFKPKERKAPYSAGPGLFYDTCNSKEKIKNAKLIEICASYKGRPAGFADSVPSPPIKQK